MMIIAGHHRAHIMQNFFFGAIFHRGLWVNRLFFSEFSLQTCQVVCTFYCWYPCRNTCNYWRNEHFTQVKVSCSSQNGYSEMKIFIENGLREHVNKFIRLDRRLKTPYIWTDTVIKFYKTTVVPCCMVVKYRFLRNWQTNIKKFRKEIF